MLVLELVDQLVRTLMKDVKIWRVLSFSCWILCGHLLWFWPEYLRLVPYVLVL
jgi:hypothetical protein